MRGRPIRLLGESMRLFEASLGDDARKLLDVLGQSLMASDGLVDAVIAAVDAHRSQDNARLEDPVLFSHVARRDPPPPAVARRPAAGGARDRRGAGRGPGAGSGARRAEDRSDSADLLLLLLISDDATRAQLARRYAAEGRGRPRRVMALIRGYEALPREALPEVPRNARMRTVPRA